MCQTFFDHWEHVPGDPLDRSILLPAPQTERSHVRATFCRVQAPAGAGTCAAPGARVHAQDETAKGPERGP